MIILFSFPKDWCFISKLLFCLRMMLRLASEVSVVEDTLMRILILGLSKDHPLSPTESLDLADQLVRKVAVFHIEGKSR